MSPCECGRGHHARPPRPPRFGTPFGTRNPEASPSARNPRFPERHLRVPFRWLPVAHLSRPPRPSPVIRLDSIGTCHAQPRARNDDARLCAPRWRPWQRSALMVLPANGSVRHRRAQRLRAFGQGIELVLGTSARDGESSSKRLPDIGADIPTSLVSKTKDLSGSPTPIRLRRSCAGRDVIRALQHPPSGIGFD